jgi:L-amino acid N-acyltransferase YncA
LIEFTPATASDLPKIVAIYNETIPTHQATADLQPQTVAEKQTWFAAHNKLGLRLTITFSRLDDSS